MVLKYLDIYTLVILKKIQKRALKFFMGVHNSTPIQAMMGDLGWTDVYIKEVLCMLRYWNKVIIMDNARLEMRIFYVGLQQRR